MDLLQLLLLIIFANTIPFSGISKTNQNFVLVLFSLLLGYEHEMNIIWLDGTVSIYGNISCTVDLINGVNTLDITPGSLDKSTQVARLSKFLYIDKSSNHMFLHMGFPRFGLDEIRVFVDGYRMEWSDFHNCFMLDLSSDLTPRTNNLSKDVFGGVTLEIRTNGVTLAHLKYT